MKRLIGLVVFFSTIIFACKSTNPYHTTNKSYKKQAKALVEPLREIPGLYASNPAAYPVGTTNFNLRKPNYVIIHHTAQNSCERTLNTFTAPKSQVSAHYVVCKDGTIHHMLNDYLRAWHGGVAKWGTITDINSVSIGIELDNNGTEEYPEVQLNSLTSLLANLKKSYGIPTSNFIGHADIAPPRKQDPNTVFPWKKLSEQGYGHWYDSVLDSVPAGFNHLQALKIIGYDVKDSTAAIVAFKRHFIQNNLNPSLSLEEKAALNSLLKKY